MKDKPENPQAAQKILRKHEYEVTKLSDIDALIDKIAKTEDEDFMNIFLDWQNQRNVCNEGYIKWVKAKVAERSKSDE